jgi:hypothetical protein
VAASGDFEAFAKLCDRAPGAHISHSARWKQPFLLLRFDWILKEGAEVRSYAVREVRSCLGCPVPGSGLQNLFGRQVYPHQHSTLGARETTSAYTTLYVLYIASLPLSPSFCHPPLMVFEPPDGVPIVS